MDRSDSTPTPCARTVLSRIGLLIATWVIASAALADLDHEPLSLLRVAGDRIVNASGHPVYLRGFQGVEFYSVDTEWYLQATQVRGEDPALLDRYAVDLHRYTLTDFDLREFRSVGANVVRIWFQLHELEKQPYRYSETALTLLEATVNAIGEQGIYVIPVLGGTGQNPFEDSQPYLKRGWGVWDRGNGIWERTVALWGAVAERLADNPYVAGYDLINEPQAPSKATLHDYYQEVIGAIRSRDRHHILFLETDVAKPLQHQLGGRYDDANLAASFHFYYPANFTLLHDPDPALRYPGDYRLCLPNQRCVVTRWDRDTLAQLFDVALHLPEVRGKPVYVGEFGADGARDGRGAKRWLGDVLSLMNERGLHYTLHRYKHRVFNGYWLIRPEVDKRTRRVRQGLRSGSIRYDALTDDQKRLLTTEQGYHRRDGMAELLRRGFAGEH